MRPFFALLGLVAFSGCMPSYQFESRPLPPMPRNDAERCYSKERIEVTSGNARWSYTDSSSTGYSTTYRTHNFSAGGLTFYRNGERLRPKEVLELLDDGELQGEYTKKLDSTSSAHTAYPILRNSALVMAFGGLALSGVALGQVLSWSQEERANNSIPVTLWIGAGLAVASAVPAILSSTTYEGAITHDRAREMFDERNLIPRLQEAIQRFNLKAAERCGLPTPPAPQ